LNSKGKLIIKFNPQVVYKKNLETKQIGKKYNLTYKFIKNETKLIRKILEGHGFEQVHSSNSAFNLMWTSAPIKLLNFKYLYPFQRVNHFPKSFELTRKDRLCKNIEKIQQEKGFKHFDFIPTTFILPHQFNQFKSLFYLVLFFSIQIFNYLGTFEKEKGIWIVKPIASSQGKGIFLINNVKKQTKFELILIIKLFRLIMFLKKKMLL
jgi:tubulin polyglutamylase TTLL5